MNILVLGGNGYLGSKLIAQLVQKKENVFSTIREQSNLSRLNEVKNNINFVKAEYTDIKRLLSNEKIDCVVNMVCDYGKKCNRDMIYSNLMFPLEVLELASTYKVDQFIAIDTALPKDLNLYSFTKNSFSEYGKFYSEKYGINFVDLKVQMYYGFDEPQDRFIPATIRKMICGDIVNTTYGTQLRDIIAVEDVVNLIVEIIYRQLRGFNSIDIGTGIAPAISELVDFIWEKTGRKSVVNKGAIPMRPNEPNCIADMSIVHRILEYKSIYWKDGINKMIDDIRRDIQ